MKVLVTGASGMVGRNLVDFLTKNHVEVIPTDLAGWPVSGNILDTDFVFTKLASLDFDAVIHLAALTEIKKTIENPKLCFEVNCFGTLNMLELALKKNVSRFVYACHDARTRALTTDGLKHYTDLNAGDYVFTHNMRTGILEPKPVQRVFIYPYEGQMVHFKGRRLDLMVTPNHNMLVQTPTSSKGQRGWRTTFERADVVAARSVCRLVTGRWVGTQITPPVPPESLPNPVDLFYLTGVFIGDGSLNGRQFQTVTSGLSKSLLMQRRDGSGRFESRPATPVKRKYFYPRVFLYVPKADKCRQRLEEVLTRDSIKWSGYDKSLYFTSDPLYRIFDDCYDAGSDSKNAHFKRIPRWMLDAPVVLLRSLLQGLLDSDGSRGKELTTVSTGLMEDTLELCAKLGYFTTVSLDHNVSYIAGRKIESTSYRIGISAKSGSPMFGTEYGNAHSDYYSGEVWCAEVENRNFLVERNGRIALSGNSSANVFGAPKRNPVTEAAPFDPRVPYDYSKVVCENMVMSYFRSKKLPVSITRSWLLFGEYDQPSRATIRFIKACLADQPLTLFNRGRDTTAPSHAVNYARLTLTLLTSEKAVGEAFNFGGEKTISIRQLAQTVKRLTRSKSRIDLAPPRSELEREPQVSYPSTTKIRTLLGYKYELTLEEGLQRTIDWVRDQPTQ